MCAGRVDLAQGFDERGEIDGRLIQCLRATRGGWLDGIPYHWTHAQPISCGVHPDIVVQKEDSYA